MSIQDIERTKRTIDVIAEEITSTIMSFAPHLLSERQRHIVSHCVARKHSYKIVKFGEDIDGQQYIEVAPINKL